MRYRIVVAGKIFEGYDPRVLLKRAVEAKRGSQRVLRKLLEKNDLPGCTKTMQNVKNSGFSSH